MSQRHVKTRLGRFSLHARKKGAATILALIVLVIFASLGIAFANFTALNVSQSGNFRNANDARLAAESGLEFLTYVIKQLAMPANLEGQALMDELNASLSTRPELMGNLGGAALTYDGATIRIPSVRLDDQRTFDAEILLVSARTFALKATGHLGVISRRISMDFLLSKSEAFCPAQGIVSRGRISFTGNAKISGLNSADEGTVYTETTDTMTLTMTGNAKVQGDFYATNPNGQASLTGNISIGGASGAALADHLHFGTSPIEIPEVDPTVFKPYATNIVNGGTSTSGNKTFTNILIAANTNPNFSGNITLKGVVYIEKPNMVTFTGNLSFTGVIVTDPGHENPGNNNQIKFTGNTSSAAIETLPDTSEFHDLRDLKGAFLLAPGFTTSFTGNFGTVNGTMAAEAFTFTGNAGGTVRGSIINYGTATFGMTGNASLTFDHQTYKDPIPGLSKSPKFSFNPDTYLEPTQ